MLQTTIKTETFVKQPLWGPSLPVGPLHIEPGPACLFQQLVRIGAHLKRHKWAREMKNRSWGAETPSEVCRLPTARRKFMCQIGDQNSSERRCEEARLSWWAVRIDGSRPRWLKIRAEWR